MIVRVAEPRTVAELHALYAASHRRIEQAGLAQRERERERLAALVAEANATLAQHDPRPRPQTIIAAVAAGHGLSLRDLTGKSQTRPVVRARFEAIVAVRELYPEKSLPTLGRLFGGRDHTTILAALRRMRATA